MVRVLGERAAGVERRAFLGENGRRHCKSGWRMGVDPAHGWVLITEPGLGPISGPETN